MLPQGVGLLLLALLAKIIGFFRDIVLSFFYGASSVVDAYVIATTIPMVVFSFVGTGIETSLIPMLSKVENEGANKSRFLSNIVNVFVTVCIIAIVIVICFPRPVVKIFASGFDDETMRITVSFTRFSILGIAFSTLSYICMSVLHYKNKFIGAAFSTILMDGIVLLFVALSSSFGVFLLPIGNVVALAVQAVYLRLLIKYHHFFSINLKDKYLREMIKIIVPVVIGTSVNQINLLIDQTLASRIMVGGIAYLNYANKVLGVFQGVFIISFISLLFPKMTEMAKFNDEKSILVDCIKRWSILLHFFLVPCTVLLCLYSDDVIRFLFQRGEFNVVDTRYTALVLLCYAIELPFYGFREIISRVYYTYRNTRLPMINSILGLFINATLSIVLAFKIGLIGLPIGTATSCIATAIFIAIQFKRDFCQENGISFFSQIVWWNILFFISALIISFSIKRIINWDSKFGFIAEMVVTMILFIFVDGVCLLKKKIISLPQLNS